MNFNFDTTNVIFIVVSVVSLIIWVKATIAVLIVRVDRLDKEIDMLRARSHDILNALAKLDVKVEMILQRHTNVTHASDSSAESKP